MAERRMFAKTIIDSDAFLDMPVSAQALYFHLSMRADDDGFINNPKKIQRAVGGADDDLKLLVAKKFIIPFDSGVVVIKHWKIHNYIRGDRKKATVYNKELSMLSSKENGAYTLKAEEPVVMLEEPCAETVRQKAYRESDLPCSFEYKIRRAFYGEPCPVCGCEMKESVDEMGIVSDIRRPTIQHNIPISKGGKHELGNISVICHKCNVTLQDTETGPLNAEEVAQKWDEICMSVKCLSSDGQVTGKCHTQVRLVEGSIVEDSVVEESIVQKNGDVVVDARVREAINKCFNTYFSTAPTQYEENSVADYLLHLYHGRAFAFDEDQRELLEIAFKTAADSGNKNLRYLDGIFKQFYRRKIFTGDDYWAYQAKRDMGIV